jgi:SAM-dependent methyltransferase
VTSTDLFAGKAEHYARYRTDYPAGVIDAALAAIQLQRSDVVADVGSGTGMLARWILERGTGVVCVEPEAGMRAVAERQLALVGPQFMSVAGTAEATTLPDSSVDVIVAGNAFHYFDPVRARAEAGRILRRPGRVLIVGHADALTPGPFTQAYGQFLRSIAGTALSAFHQPDRYTSSLRAFFGSAAVTEADVVQSAHPMSWDALSGRFRSTSLMPQDGDPRQAQVLAGLKDLFDAFAVAGTVELQLGWRYAWGTLLPRI